MKFLREWTAKRGSKKKPVALVHGPTPNNAAEPLMKKRKPVRVANYGETSNKPLR
jgi:hypothetical protein